MVIMYTACCNLDYITRKFFKLFCVIVVFKRLYFTDVAGAERCRKINPKPRWAGSSCLLAFIQFIATLM
jgi:hypothetical protein